METKICNKCKIERNIEDYHKSKRHKNNRDVICRFCVALRSKKYQENNRDIILIRKRKRYIRDREKNLIYNELHRERYKKRRSEKRKERRNNDNIYMLSCDVRYRIWFYLKKLNITKRNKTFDIVGCTPQELKEHLEKQFKDGMSWENRNEWHIDHIIPLCSATTEDELYKLCHYTNLQPLWATENIKKGGKIL